MEENTIQIFNHSAFCDVRVIKNGDNPLFCLSDICKAVELTNPSSVKKRLDAEDVQLIDLHALNGGSEYVNGNSVATFINESGFYDVLLFSSSDKVRPFRKWITSEVLPSIRRNGGYMVAKADDSAEDIMARALLIAQDTLKRREERIKALESDNDAQKHLLDEQKPKVVFAEAVAGSTTSILIGELAKILRQNGVKDMGQQRLFDWLRANHYLGSCGAYYNIPNQKYIEQGLFELKTNTFSVNGEMKTRNTTKVTGKGQQYFINKFLGAQA